MTKTPVRPFEVSELKGYSRHLLFNMVVQNFMSVEGELRAVTLPGLSFEIEEMLHAGFDGRMKLDGLEADESVYNHGRHIIKERGLPMALHHQDAESFFATGSTQFDLTWMDYCGRLSHDKAAAFEHMCRGNRFRFRDDGSLPMFVITLAGKREDDGWKERAYEFLTGVKTRKPDIRNFAMRAIGNTGYLNNIARQYHKTLEVVLVMSYVDHIRNVKATPMYMHICRVHPRLLKFDPLQTPLLQLYGNTVEEALNRAHKP